MAKATREVAFAVYDFKVGEPYKEALELHNANGADVFQLFCDSLTASCSELWTTEESCTWVASCTSNRDRYIWGSMHVGQHGERRPIVAARGTGVNIRGYVEPDQAASDSYFYCLHVPKGRKVGFIMLQQRGNTCNFSYFSKAVGRPAFITQIKLDSKGLSETEMLDFAKEVFEAAYGLTTDE